ncbi:MAG TPA: hypothetical protein RMG48_20255 [Myxococcales bacterium LLY-WYZ-16_1]|nr:hypothetical protein [Myxococcales bacterium LLY-WYZ-16_1]
MRSSVRAFHAEVQALLRRGRAAVEDAHLRQLRATVALARDIPLYARRLRGLPEHFDLADYGKLPVLERHELKSNLDRLLHPRPPEPPLKDSTGGSTGVPTPFYRCRSHRAFSAALDHLTAGWVGGGLGRRTVVLWGAPRDVPRSVPWARQLQFRLRGGTLVLGCHRTDPQTLDHVRRIIERTRPHLIRGYRSILLEFARHLDAAGPLRHRPKAVLSAAEILLPEQRARLEEALGAPVFDRYGNREAGLLAAEGPSKLLHVMLPAVHLEVVSAQGVNVEGESGSILITPFRNPVMPLLRYRTHDGGIWLGAVPGDQPLPGMQLTVGRDRGLVELACGQKLSLSLFSLSLRHASDVLQWQLVRTGPDALRLDVRADPPLAPERLRALEAGLKPHVGPQVRLEVRTVDEVARNRTGKAELYVDESTAEAR